MKNMDDFEKSSRGKYRYETSRGSVSTEDLWDLPMTGITGCCLDDLEKDLNSDMKNCVVESYVLKKSNMNETTERKLSIVRHIIDTRLAEKDQKENEAVNAQEKEKILGVIAKKKDAGLEERSLEDLEKMAKDL